MPPQIGKLLYLRIVVVPDFAIGENTLGCTAILNGYVNGVFLDFSVRRMGLKEL